MAYLGDPRENSVDLNKHALWENDNRVENRYLWNGSVLDLCDLSPEEYMKNPVVEAIKESSSKSEETNEKLINAINDNSEKIITKISSSTDTVVNKMSSDTDTIVEAIGAAADEIVSSTSGVIHTQVVFHYGSLNNMIDPSSTTSSDFETASATINSEMYINYVLGDPNEEDWAEFEDGSIDESELRNRSYNTYYLLLPNSYGRSRKFVVIENGVNDKTSQFQIVEGASPIDGYVLLACADEQNFNLDFPTEKNVKIMYSIKILR